ncbi:hypothetical protein JCM3766R1_006519 [Sporobolomyces carnicolor]
MNNPFAKQPQSIVDQTAERFPPAEIPSPPPQSQFGYNPQFSGGYQQQGGFAPQYAQQQQQQPQQYYQQPQNQQQQYQQALYPQSTGFANQAQYGQYSGGYPSQGQSQGSYGNTSFANTSDLDPYASLGNMNAPPSSSNPSSSSQAILHVQQSQSHPRQFVQENKQGLMGWDEYCWKQLFGRVDALREAWEQRVAGIKAAANQGADPTSVDQLRREAESNVDSIHAAKMQMNEVKSGWKHSTDPASKSRVREALNAGLSAMPEYPQPINPEQLGGSFYRNATQQYQKSSIMSQFGGGGGSYYPGQGGGGPGNAAMMPQQTGYGGYNSGGGLQPQQTGYGYAGYQPQYF